MVQRLLKQAEETDRAEDQQYGTQEGPTLPSELKEKRARLARMEQALAKLKQQQEDGDRSQRTDPETQTINYTDSDSRIMSRRHKGSIQGYNGQIAVTGDGGLIVGATLSNNPIDAPQLIPTLDAVQDAIGAQPEKLSADTGYFSGENLAEVETREIDGYIADGITETKRDTNAYSKDHFEYDPEQDAYRCPQEHWLPFKKEYLMPDGRVQRRYADPAVCDLVRCVDCAQSPGKATVSSPTTSTNPIERRCEPNSKRQTESRNTAAAKEPLNRSGVRSSRFKATARSVSGGLRPSEPSS